MSALDIFRAPDGAPFLGGDDAAVAEALRAAASTVLGAEVSKDAPTTGTAVHRVATVDVRSVADAPRYHVEAEILSKPEVGRAPSGEAGTWAVQSLIFDKEQFTQAQAEQWIKDAPEFENLGAEETGTSFRFRQYDPEHFARFRIVRITDGVSAVYGEIAAKDAAQPTDADKATSIELLDDAVTKLEAARAVTKGIVARGVRVARLAKEEAPAEDEERFVLGLVLEPNDGADGPRKPDTQGDVYSAKAIRDAAHNWMEHHGQVDLNHSWRALGKNAVRVLESYLAPADFDIGDGDDAYHVVKGTWLLGLRIADDGLWQKVQTGKLGAFSIGGTAQRVPEPAPAAEV